MRVNPNDVIRLKDFLGIEHKNYDVLEIRVEHYNGPARRGWIRAIPHTYDWGVPTSWHCCCYVEIGLSNSVFDLEENYKIIRGRINGGITFHDPLPETEAMVIGCDYNHGFNDETPELDDVVQSFIGLALTAKAAEDKYDWLTL